MELSWADLGREPELTTVTKLPRRIFTWSDNQYVDAIKMLGVTDPFINFMNYMKENDRLTFISRINRMGPKISYLGFGPSETDVLNAHQQWYI
jgi:hypothetical protein